MKTSWITAVFDQGRFNEETITITVLFSNAITKDFQIVFALGNLCKNMHKLKCTALWTV